MDHQTLIILLAAFFGLLMTWGVGANDLANVLSTSVGSKAVSIRLGIVIAVIFEFAGALLGGGEVTNTIRSGLIDVSFLANTPHILIYGMLAAMAAGSVWMFLASYWGMPVSITHTIVGSVLGFGVVVVGVDAIHWEQVELIAVSWVISPIIASVAAYLLLQSVQRSIIGTADPLINARRYVPLYLFLVGFVLSAITVIKGLRHLGYTLGFGVEVLIAFGCGLIVLGFGSLLLRRVNPKEIGTFRQQFGAVERMFGVLMIFTACAMVFAHGSNDVAIAMGPMTAIIGIVLNQSTDQNGLLVYGTLAYGCVGVVLGLMMYGRKVMRTVGKKITELTPSRAFCATLSAASVVVVSTSIGIPVSATTTLVGGVLGVGLARGIGALDVRVMRNIFMSWVVTIPVGATLTIIFFYLFQHVLNIAFH